MAFQVKPFVEVLKLSKEALDDVLAPIRARSARAKSVMIAAKLEEDMIDTERRIHEACAEKELNFDNIITLIETSTAGPGLHVMYDAVSLELP